MCCKNFWKRIVPFTLTAVISLLVVNYTEYLFSESSEDIKSIEVIFPSNKREGIGISSCSGRTDFDAPISRKLPKISKLYILSKPRAQYTEIARQNQVTAIVRVRVKFLPTGSIGSVTPLNSLPDGLTEQAIAAAKQIKFQPELRNGEPTAITKVVEYSFNIY